MGNTPIDWPAIIGIVLGVYGAVLSSVLAVRGHFRDRRKVQVTCGMGLVVGSRSFRSDNSKLEVVIITAVNVGHRPVEITGMGFWLTTGQQLLALADINNNMPLPKMLTEGGRVMMTLDLDGITSEINSDRRTNPGSDIRLRHAYIQDSTGKEWTCSMPQVLIDRGFA